MTIENGEKGCRFLCPSKAVFRAKTAVCEIRSPPIHLNGGSAFMLQEWGMHSAQQKNTEVIEQEVEQESTFAKTQPNVTLHWPITYTQANIPGVLLCNVKVIFDCLGLPLHHRNGK